MVIINPTELSNNLTKYLHIAQTEKVIIQQSQDVAYELVKREHPVTGDVSAALTGAQLKARIHKRIDNLFSA
jgi:hypothetical protein